MPQLFVWKKLASAKWEDAWVERLAFIGPARLAITTVRGAKFLRIAAYALTRREADDVVRAFGGHAAPQQSDCISEQAAPRPPIRVRDRLIISDRADAAARQPGRTTLVIPAGMAFGTGDHATTSSCLRLLCDASRSLQDWTLLDLGTGSGILAIAARALGARRVEAYDFDPAALRVARENIARNKMDGITLRRLNVTRWSPRRQFSIVAANLFSEVLIAAAPSIARSLAADGALILSGVLRHQEPECLAAFTRENLRAERVTRKGEWIAALLRRQV